MNKFTFSDFKAMYPNDDACLDKIFQIRFGEMSICPKCEADARFTKTKNRRSYQCLNCGFQLYPTAHTVFDKTTTPLTSWFHAIYLQCATRNGVAAKELERQLNVCYKTALRMAHQIKMLMANTSLSPLSGVIEADEVYIGGKVSNMHADKRKAYGNSRYSLKSKMPVVALVERKGSVVAKVMDEPNREKVDSLVSANLNKEAHLITDTSSLYMMLSTKYRHDLVNHDSGEYVRKSVHTNTVENFFSVLKRTIKGTHIHVSKQHLQKYVDEVAFRYVNRNEPEQMFEKVLRNV